MERASEGLVAFFLSLRLCLANADLTKCVHAAAQMTHLIEQNSFFSRTNSARTGRVGLAARVDKHPVALALFPQLVQVRRHGLGQRQDGAAVELDRLNVSSE
jgi:hypothetical protein